MKQTRLYLVQETGPTNLIFKDDSQKKFKVLIGDELKCSCGGGIKEHCIHTLFALIRVYKMSEGN